MKEDRVPWFQRVAEHLSGNRRGVAPPVFVELPHGLFTASGTWFHVREADLEEYAGDVLRRIPLERLIREAETVLRSPQTLTLWGLLGMLVFVSPVQAALSAVVVFLAWSVLFPGFVTLGGIRLFGWLETVPIQGLTFTVVLSLLGSSGRPSAVWVGLAGFIALRWGLIDLVVTPMAQLIRRSLYRLPLPDQTLRAVIIRHALAQRIPLVQLDAMETRMMDIALRGKRSRRPESDR